MHINTSWGKPWRVPLVRPPEVEAMSFTETCWSLFLGSERACVEQCRLATEPNTSNTSCLVVVGRGVFLHALAPPPPLFLSVSFRLVEFRHDG